MQTLLGDLPLLQYSDPSSGNALGAGNFGIVATTAGVAEVQKIVISSDAGFVREVQSLTLSGATGGTFDVTLSGADDSVQVAYDATDAVLEVGALRSPSSTYMYKKTMTMTVFPSTAKCYGDVPMNTPLRAHFSLTAASVINAA